MTMLAKMAISRRFGHLPFYSLSLSLIYIYLYEDGQLTILKWKVAKMAKFMCMAMLTIFKVSG